MSDRATDPAGEISFGPFRLRPAQRLLLEGETPVSLGGRARDLLLALVERPGQLVSKEDLLARVWPNTFVDEGNLKVHVAALRRALGDGRDGHRYIENVPGRGYCFVAPTTVWPLATATLATPASSGNDERPRGLPLPLARMVGRSGTVATLSALLTRHRFLTIVGPGGIGKTTVAVAVAEGLAGSFRDGLYFVDLAPLSDPHLVATAVASALGIGVRSEDPVGALLPAVRDKELLIVLDSCEHVIETAAVLAEQLFAGAGPGLHILSTSREPLRVDGERVHRLPALDCPPSAQPLTAAEALGFSAVQLFVERAAAGVDGFTLTDADVPVVADLCRRLDGMALAIEIAAGRVDAFGIGGLATRLDARFRLLLRGRRTALPRHQTLSTTLDWSYALLPEVERVVLRRLSVMAGRFTMDSAAAVLADDDTSRTDLVDAVANLVAKSLVAADVGGAVALYRLLDTTQAYAAGKLSESGERERVERHHAEFVRGALMRAEAAWERQAAADWIRDHRFLIDDVRAALDWAFSPSGNGALGVALTACAVPLWFQSSLIAECSERVRHALAMLPEGDNPAHEMRLHAALAWSLMQTRSLVAETTVAWSRTLELARAQDDADYQLRAMWGLWAGLLNRGAFQEALALARQFEDFAARRSDLSDRLVGDRMIGYILHLLGQQAEARRHLERMVAGYAVPVTGARTIRFIFEQRATARCFLARILWLQGSPDQAVSTVESIVAGAVAGDDMLTLCQVLVQAACPVAFFTGDLVAAERWITMLEGASTRNALVFWQSWARCFRGVLLLRHGNVAAGLPLLAEALERLKSIQYGIYYIVFLAEFAEALGAAGEVARGTAAIDEALARSEQNGERWYAPELMRVKGELALRSGAPEAASNAEQLFSRALAEAREQETPAWELRVALSLGRLWHDKGQILEARALLAQIHDRFTEGFATADLRDAAALRHTLAA